jgi:hypothetical protein
VLVKIWHGMTQVVRGNCKALTATAEGDAERAPGEWPAGGRADGMADNKPAMPDQTRRRCTHSHGRSQMSTS